MKEMDIDCPEPRTHDAAALVAAAVTVAHRRTTDEVVGIRWRVTGASGTRHGVLRAVVSGDTSFGALRAWAATEIEALNTGAPRTADEGSGVPSLEAVFTEAADGGLLLAEVRDP
ncbi:hypothetical protein, partial [Streptomyces sp. N50]|uniref:hypothetical protein n=1 Tax=Streptomyces sp. N50 TaxID=3081765 RepID=UPI002961FCE8